MAGTSDSVACEKQNFVLIINAILYRQLSLFLTIKMLLFQSGFLVRTLFRPHKRLFLGALAKLRKATTNFVMSVLLSLRLSFRPAVLVQQLNSYWMDFVIILYLRYF